VAGKTKSFVCANKKGSTSRTEVGENRRNEKGGARIGERSGPFFGRIYRSRIVYMCLCVCVCVYARAPVNSTAKSLEFHFCLPAGEHYRSFCRRCEGFWFWTGAARSEFLPLLGRKPSSGNLRKRYP